MPAAPSSPLAASAEAGPQVQTPAPHVPRLGVQGPMGTPRPGVPGPVSRPGGLPPPPVVSPPVRPVPHRALAPGQPIYQPPPGVRRRAGPPREGVSPGGMPRTVPGLPVPPGRYERRPLHPTRTRPGGVGAPPAIGDRPRPTRAPMPAPGPGKTATWRPAAPGAGGVQAASHQPRNRHRRRHHGQRPDGETCDQS